MYAFGSPRRHSWSMPGGALNRFLTAEHVSQMDLPRISVLES